MKIYKTCKYCNGYVKINSNRCNKCGRLKNNLILGEYSPEVKEVRTYEDVKLANENFIPKKKYPTYRENIVPNREAYPIANSPRENSILDITERGSLPLPYISKYDYHENMDKYKAEIFANYIKAQRRSYKYDIYDVIVELSKKLIRSLEGNLLFKYIFCIVLVVVFLIWFLGGLFII